jgi:hypothetical protein
MIVALLHSGRQAGGKPEGHGSLNQFKFPAGPRGSEAHPRPTVTVTSESTSESLCPQ